MKYTISGSNIEYLESREIEAKSEQEAKEKYQELWEEGELLSSNSDFEMEAEEAKPCTH